MYIEIHKDGYWFKETGIRNIEELYTAKYMGYWETEKGNILDVFFQPNPNFDLGHDYYFGLYRESLTDVLYITNANSCFKNITGILLPSGEVLVSRYRHNYVSKDGYFVDGGRAYIRYGWPGSEPPKQIKVDIICGKDEFIFEVLN